MGPALKVRSNQIVAGYASVAGNIDHHNMDPGKGIEQCPHASAARAAARMAEDLAAAARAKEKENKAKGASACPFHKMAAEAAANKPVAPAAGKFDYEEFYVKELDKKHQDKSYRYFNNINRLAAKFPVAHTGNVNDQVEVWCANDYLGMGNNPVVLETMQ
jgi:5-aminolevulinate synthase